MKKQEQEKVLKLCEIYFSQHGNLAVPRKYILFYMGKEERLGEKLIKMRQDIKNSIKNGKKLNFSYEFLEKLANMDSNVFKLNYSRDVRREKEEQQILKICKEYYNVHGNLAIPQNYVVEDIRLGEKLSNIKEAYKKINNAYSQEFFQELQRIDNRVFEKNYGKNLYFSNLEQEFYDLFESYATQYGNLKIPKNYRVVNSITGKTTDLYRRLFEVKQAKAGKNDKNFSQEFFDNLEALDPNVFNEKSKVRSL